MIGHLVVELVTPAMIGGAVARECDDPPTLRPPSLRGHLRFWSRALGDSDLEQALWGEEKLGQRVRILSAATVRSQGQRVDLKPVAKATLLAATEQHGETRPEMVPPGDQVVLRFGIPDGVSLPHLQAVLWTWLHLGTVGRRSRRGYGSLQWRPSRDDLLTGWPPLWPTHHLRSKAALQDYLETGLTRVGSICRGRPDRSPRQVTEGLMTLDQVFVGKELPGIWEASRRQVPSVGERLESIVHGLNEKARGADPDRAQLGFANPQRQPSPLMWRLFRMAGKDAFLPVMTWFPLGYPAGPVYLDKAEGVFRYLHGDLGFEKSLTGNELGAERPFPFTK